MYLGRSLRRDVRHQRCHDHFPETTPLMVRINRNIHDVEEEGSISDDAAHADRMTSMADDDGEHCVWEAGFGSGGTSWRKTAYAAQATIIRNLGGFVMRRIAGGRMHVALPLLLDRPLIA